MRVLRISRILVIAGVFCCALAISMTVRAQASETAKPPAPPLHSNCDLEGCEIWFAAPGEIGAGAFEWEISANGVLLDLAPQVAAKQSIPDLNIMYVIDTSAPLRDQALLDFYNAVEDTSAQLAQRGIDPAQLEHMHISVAFLHLYQNDPVTFWCYESADAPCAKNNPAWEYTNLRGVSNAVALMLSNTSAANVEAPPLTEFAEPFARAMAAFDEVDGPKLVICFCEGLGPSETTPGDVRVDDVAPLIEAARQKNIRVHVKHAWKAAYGDASQSLARLAQATGGVFVAQETVGIAPILDDLASQLTPYTVKLPWSMLGDVQGNAKIDIAVVNLDGISRTVVSTVLDVPVAPAGSFGIGEHDTPGSLPTSMPSQTPKVTPERPTATPDVGGTNGLQGGTVSHMPLLLALSTVAVSLAGLGVFFIGRGRPTPGNHTMIAEDTEPILKMTDAPTSAEDDTVRMADTHLVAEFVLAHSPVETTIRLPLHGNHAVWAIGRSQQRLMQSYPHAVPLTLSSPHVSREHALLRFDGRQFILEPVLSADPENPVTSVRVNDTEIRLNARHILHSGDAVSFSTARYWFHIRDAKLVAVQADTQTAPDVGNGQAGVNLDPDITWKQPIKETVTHR
jgi:hypothetical protein